MEHFSCLKDTFYSVSTLWINEAATAVQFNLQIKVRDSMCMIQSDLDGMEFISMKLLLFFRGIVCTPGSRLDTSDTLHMMCFCRQAISWWSVASSRM